MTARPDPAVHRAARTVRLAFAALALTSLVTGFALYALAERLGLDQATARLLSTAFLVAAAVDALILYFWDAIFTRKP